VRVIHRQIDRANVNPAALIAPPSVRFLTRHLRMLVVTDPSGGLFERRSPVFSAELIHAKKLRPHNAWAWLLTRLVDGPYIAGQLLARKRVRGAARALFSRLPPLNMHLREPKAITERLLLPLYRADGILKLSALREELKIGRHQRRMPQD
jgi:hypothetical protein